MGGKKGRHRAPSATPWDGIPEGDLTPPQAIVAASQRAIYAFRHDSDSDSLEFSPSSRQHSATGLPVEMM